MRLALPDEIPAANGHTAKRQPLMSPSEMLLLFVLASIQFTHIVDFMIVMPLGPVFMREMTLEPGQFANVVSAYTISAGVAALMAARLLDRFDRKRALVVLYSGFVAGTLLCAVASTYWLLLAARTVAGAFGGVASAVVLAIVGDAFHDSRRGMAMGVIMSAFSVASIAGVPLGIELADRFGWHAPFAILGAAGACVLVTAIVVLPPLRGHIGRHDAPQIELIALLRNPNHVRAFALMSAMVLGTFTVFPFLATYLTVNVGLTSGEIKWMYIVGGGVTLLTLTYVGRLADRFGKLLVFRIFAGATIVAVLLVSNLPHGMALTWVLAVTTFLIFVTSARMVPAMALITASAIPAERGGFMSLNTAVQHLVSGLAVTFGGALLSQPVKDGPLIGFSLIGALACLATLASLPLAGHSRRPASGELAPDAPVLVEILE